MLQLIVGIKLSRGRTAGWKLTSSFPLLSHCCSNSSPFPLLSYPVFWAIAGWYSRPSAAAMTPQHDLSSWAQTVGNALAVWTPDWRACGHVPLWYRAASKHRVQLERTLKLCPSSLPSLIVHSLNNSPHYPGSAPPVRKLHMLPPIIVDPAPLKVKIWFPQRRPHVKSGIWDSVLHHVTGIKGGSIRWEKQVCIVVVAKEILKRTDVGFWLWLVVNIPRGRSCTPQAVCWVGLLNCYGGRGLKLWLICVFGWCVQRGDVTKVLKSERVEQLFWIV